MTYRFFVLMGTLIVLLPTTFRAQSLLRQTAPGDLEIEVFRSDDKEPSYSTNIRLVWDEQGRLQLLTSQLLHPSAAAFQRGAMFTAKYYYDEQGRLGRENLYELTAGRFGLMQYTEYDHSEEKVTVKTYDQRSGSLLANMARQRDGEVLTRRVTLDSVIVNPGFNLIGNYRAEYEEEGRIAKVEVRGSQENKVLEYDYEPGLVQELWSGWRLEYDKQGRPEVIRQKGLSFDYFRIRYDKKSGLIERIIRKGFLYGTEEIFRSDLVFGVTNREKEDLSNLPAGQVTAVNEALIALFIGHFTNCYYDDSRRFIQVAHG